MSRLLIVSNRLPVTVRLEGGEVSVSRSAGGLATAMRGPHERLESEWIGWPGDVSRMTPEQRRAIDERLAGMRTVPVHLTSQQITRYYDGFSNGVLWPLFHYLIEKVQLDARRDWEVYVEVNERFADVVVERYRPGDTIWIHDYQLTLVPALVRAKIPDARIGFFLHIPFPSSEVFRLLPWREQVLHGLLGADVLGFHTAAFRHNFTYSAARVLGLDPDTDHLHYEDRTVKLGVYPIGIDAEEFVRLAGEPAVDAEVAQVRASSEGQTIVLGVDRFDYTKGIPRRLLGFERLLERRPDLRKKIRFIQLAVPTREKVEAYAELRRNVNELVGRINAQYGTISGVPIHFLHRGVPPEQLVALYRAADVMLVTPLRDGMNLVAKEYVATRTDDTGALVLSEFAGAADELTQSFLVNPYDLGSIASVLERAIVASPEEKRARMRMLRKQVLTHDVHEWARHFLDDLAPDATGKPARVTAPPPETLAESLRAAPALELFLDYDGTLVPHAMTPELARPDPELLALLQNLSLRPRTRVHIVSGRLRGDLDDYFGAMPVALHAEHGFWSRPQGSSWKPMRDPNEALRWKDDVRTVMEDLTRRTGGAFVEEKTASLAWHYRLVDPELASARIRELRLMLVDFLRAHDLEILAGAKVVEIRCRGVNKGAVVPIVLCEAPPQAKVVAIGDDRTDEDMFEALPEGAIAIHVGRGTSRASYRLPSPIEVRALLAALV